MKAQLQRPLAGLIAAGLVASGCSDGKSKDTPPVARITNVPTTTAPPNLTASQLKQAFIAPKEIGPEIQARSVAVLALKERAAPMCSASSAKLSGTPDITTRQFTNPRGRFSGANYAQLIARYSDLQSASTAYASLKKSAQSCPRKRHVPPKRIPGNFILNEHDDTWNVKEDSIGRWTHLRGIEKHVEPPAQTRFNIFHFAYDYATFGNVLIATMYWERTEPGKPAEPILNRATAVLTKQLQKIG